MRAQTQMRRAGLAQVLAAMVAVLSVSACGRTVSWEEEVPLNTGETIWVERTMPWEPQGRVGNPFDIELRPTRLQSIHFVYAGKEYTYTGRANVGWIAISSDKKPVLVAPAGDYGWYQENTYYCTTPYYVQLIPDESGKTWTWPDRIEPWLFGLPANVMANIPLLDERRPARYTAAMRDQRDLQYRREFKSGGHIDPDYKTDACITRIETFERTNHV